MAADLNQWICEVEAEANRRHEQREQAKADYRRAVREAIYSDKAAHVAAFLEQNNIIGYTGKLAITEQEIFAEHGWLKRTNQP